MALLFAARDLAAMLGVEDLFFLVMPFFCDLDVAALVVFRVIRAFLVGAGLGESASLSDGEGDEVSGSGAARFFPLVSRTESFIESGTAGGLCTWGLERKVAESAKDTGTGVF
jgi:hypothetical protein